MVCRQEEDRYLITCSDLCDPHSPRLPHYTKDIISVEAHNKINNRELGLESVALVLAYVTFLSVFVLRASRLHLSSLNCCLSEYSLKCVVFSNT